MKSRTIFHFRANACILILLASLGACESATDGQEFVAVHPLPPTGNSLINSQRAYDVPAGFDRIVEDMRGGYFVTGPSARVGRLDASQDLEWSDNTLLSVGDVRHVASLGPWSDAVIAVGSIDLDGDGAADAGGVAFYDMAGTLIDTACVYSDTLALSLNGVVATASGDPGRFVVVGKVIEGTQRPFAATISLASAGGTINVLADSTYDGMSGMSFDAVTAEPPPVSRFYVARNSASATTIVEIDDAFDVGWEAVVEVAEGQNYRLRALQLNSGNVFAAGEVQIDKGDYFARAGLVASFTMTGDSNWVDSLSTGGLQDAFDGLVVTDGTLYAVGRGAQLFASPPGGNLGYGLFCGFDAATGTPKFAQTLGVEDRWSGFRSVFVSGSTAVGAGFRQDPNTATREGWLIDMDVPQSE